MRHCARLLKPEGFFIIQTPEYKEHITYPELHATKDIFLRHIEDNWEEHLYLFSRRSAGMFFERLGYPVLGFENPVYSYDMFFTAGKTPRPRQTPDQVATTLAAQPPPARLVLALLDKAFESNDRWWEIQRLKDKSAGH